MSSTITPTRGSLTAPDRAGVVGSGLGAGLFVVFENRMAVDFHGDAVAPDDDVLGPPLVVFGGSHAEVHQAVEAAGFDPISMTDVDLGLEAVFGPTGFLIF